MRDIVIVGGGITGLSAGHFLKPNLSSIILESSNRVGGKIATDIVDSPYGEFRIEHGPDSFITSKPWALELARDLGLSSELLPTNDYRRHIFVLKNGKMQKLPDGLMLMVPTQIMPFATTSLISPFGKARAAMELFVPRKTDTSDESVGSFVRRRLGQEILNYFAQPILSGIYNADPEEQSLQATFPQFSALEQKYGSLIKGMLSTKRPKSGPLFVSFKNGMQTLVQALEKQLDPQIQRRCMINSIRKIEQAYEVVLDNGQQIQTKQILLTTSALQSSHLLKEVAPKASSLLQSFKTNSSSNIFLAFRKADIAHSLNGFGVVIPKVENRSINAITWVSSKLAHRAPADTVLIRVFASDTPSNLENIARQELKDMMNIDAKPLFTRSFNSINSNPQYEVGHLDKVNEVEKSLPPGISIAGSAFRGVGIPDCVYQAKQVAQKISASLLIALFVVTGCVATPIKRIQRELGIANFSQFERIPKTERWNLVDDPKWNRSQLLQDFNELGLVNQIVPQKKNYKSAVLLGATGPRMQLRINYLIKLWEAGVRFDRVVFLTGDRRLSDVDHSHAKNETELFKQLWKNTTKPKELAKLPNLWVDTPATFDENGNLKRPTTVTTIIQWRAIENVDNEDLLAISDQPFVKYQQCALENFMPRTAHIETVGPVAESDTLISVYLDVMAQDIKVCRSFP